MKLPLLPSKELLTIKEVSQGLKISKYTLRFWEKELEGILMPVRTRGQHRRYTPEQLLILKEIKKLKRKGQSLSEIKRRLHGKYDPGLDQISNEQKIDLLANQIAEMVRSTVQSFLQRESSD